MLIGYMRVSKADGSQTLDLRRDALLAAGVEAGHLYEDQVGELCAELGITRQTLYRHVDPNGLLRPDGKKLLGRIRTRSATAPSH